MYPISPTEIAILNLRTNSYQKLRSIDFRPYNRSTDPVYHLRHAFYTFTPTPLMITKTTPAPSSLSQAGKFPDAAQWAKAHNKELHSLDNKHIIKWISSPPSATHPKPIALTMAYKYKRDDSGKILERKARCAVRGDRMIPNLHFDPNQVTTYVAERPTVRILFCLAAAQGLSIEQFDIHSAFLHEPYTYDRPVYIRQYPRFDGSLKHPGTLGILQGNLYGTPPAGHIYFSGLRSHLLQHGFKQSNADPCLFIRHHHELGTLLVSVTIDDFLAVAKHQRHIDILYKILSLKYQVKRKGIPKLFLNWKVTHSKQGDIHISQPHTISTILSKLRMLDCNPRLSPYLNKSPAEPPPRAPQLTKSLTSLYRTTLGDLRYIADSTRPDIYHCINRLSTAMREPTTEHWTRLKHLLRYLRRTVNYGILLKRSNKLPTLKTYSDADYGNTKDRKSYTGTVHTTNGSPVMWTSSKQKS